MLKLLLYCCKAMPYLYYNWNTDTYHVTNSLKDLKGDFGGSRVCSGEDRLCAYQSDGRILTNGHIMAECDFEVEEIKGYGLDDYYATNGNWQIIENGLCDDDIESLNYWDFYKKSCLSFGKLDDYFDAPNENKKVGYAIHIKNLHIFDSPKELSDYYKYIGKPIINAPQNMMKAFSIKEYSRRYVENGYVYEVRGDDITDYILISIRPEYLADILNENKKIEKRKKVLKEMLK